VERRQVSLVCVDYVGVARRVGSGLLGLFAPTLLVFVLAFINLRRYALAN